MIEVWWTSMATMMPAEMRGWLGGGVKVTPPALHLHITFCPVMSWTFLIL